MDSRGDSTWPEIKQRAHYVGWLAAAVAAMALMGLTTDLLAVAVTGGTVGREIIPLLYACAIVPPYVYVWRKHGEACCGFRELEHALDAAIHSPPAGRSARFAEVVALIERIEQARGIERQLVRNEAKQWVLQFAATLNDDEREYVADHLGYLHKR